MFREHISEIGRTTTHYYDLKDKLGSGASCDVYKGMQERSGKVNALKIYKTTSWSQSIENIREVEAFSKLKHPNIVEFYGKEEERGTGRGVLVMEYCSGGSLLSLLNEPENSHGLNDEEFMTFLDHTCAGLVYLRKSGFLHRDIKPGNIVRRLSKDGSVTYKLTDLGASKHVDDDNGQFMSLAGTEEYLHPAIFERAFIDRTGNSSFDESADLWSFGVTIYHAATGSIPFKPYGGVRNNRQAMYTIISCKPRGSISGKQCAENGEFTWKWHLPNYCPLSEIIRKHVTSLIAGLVEAEHRFQWTLTTLQYGVNKITKLRKFNLVFAEGAKAYVVYIPISASFSVVQEEVAKLTDVPASQQMLFVQDHHLTDDISIVNGVLFDDSSSVILVKRDDNEDECSHANRSIEQCPRFSARVNVDQDISIATLMCIFVNSMLKRIVESVVIVRAQKRVHSCLWSNIKRMLGKIEKNFTFLSGTNREKLKHFDLLKELGATRKELFNGKVSEYTNETKMHISKLHKQMWQAKDAIEKIRTDIGSNNTYLSCTKCADATSTSMKKSVTRLEKQLSECHECLTRIKSCKKGNMSSEYQLEIYNKDRRDLTRLCTDSEIVYQKLKDEIRQPTLIHVREVKSDFMSREKKLLLLQCLLEDVRKDSDNLSKSLLKLQDAVRSILDEKNISICILTCLEDFKQSKVGECQMKAAKEEYENRKQMFCKMMEGLPELKIME